MKYIVLLLILASCGSKTATNMVQKQSQGLVFAIPTFADSSKSWAICLRTIYVKEQVGDKVIWDTTWQYPKYDSGRKDPKYIPISSDSIRWRGIEGVALDSLLKKTSPLR